ncbi:hypothetical protein [Dendrosporobacter sp. 1207_IL3150]|uniref:hypothetical protein n=1 Tax=Dendrosporobacter sp. 1207_IL3150 TaxID=3084054 RepID=UPI002FDAF6C1
MAIQPDSRDILEVFLIANLANIAQNNPILNFPPELQDFVNTQVLNNIGDASYNVSFASDLRQILSTFILDNINTLENIS